MQINVTYGSTHNGLYIADEDGIDLTFNEDRPEIDVVANKILERTHELCDEDGYLEEDFSQVEAIIKEEFASILTPNDELIIEEDSTSS